VGTYTIVQDDPLRLGTEVTHPRDKLHVSCVTRRCTNCIVVGTTRGAGNFNDNMKRIATFHLQNETYLNSIEQGTTIEKLVGSEIMPSFENDIKRSFRLSPVTATFASRQRGLKQSATNSRVWVDALVLSHHDMLSIFQECSDTISELMKAQITHALSNGTNINKVVLVGEFGDSPALKQFSTPSLREFNKTYGSNAVLVIIPRGNLAGSVAKGGLMRARNKGRPSMYELHVKQPLISYLHLSVQRS
jgi:hypothetical protein